MNGMPSKLQFAQPPVGKNRPKPVGLDDAAIGDSKCVYFFMVNQHVSQNSGPIDELMQVHPLQGNSIAKDVALLPNVALIEFIKL